MIGNKFLSVAGASEPTDAQFNYVTMLLHGDGTNGAQNNTFLDSSTNNFTITRNGNTTQGSFSPYGSGWSNYFGSADSSISVPSGANLRFGTSSMCVEAWIFPTATPAGSQGQIVGDWTTGGSPGPSNWSLYFTGTAIYFSAVNAGFNYYDQGYTNLTGSVSQNVWTHVAATFDGTTLRLFINGVLAQSASYSGFSTNAGSYSSNIVIGDYTSFSGYYYTGYISNLRIVKGSAVYTSAFTPSTTPLTAITNTQLLTCQSNRFVDNSANALTVTATNSPSVQRFNPFGTSTAYSTATIGGSGYFDGSGDYLSLTNNASMNLGTGDFTCEYWLYVTSLPAAFQLVIDFGSSNYFGLQKVSSTTFKLDSYNGSQNPISTATNLAINTWYHIACVRQSGNLKYYINGVLDSTTAFGSNMGQSSGTTSIGYSLSYSNYYVNGYLTDLRVVKGTAVYTTAFTPPTTPLTAISGTSLLTNFTNGAIYDNAMMNDLETVGNAQISTSVKKYGTGSMAFDGTGDYLITAPTNNVSFGTGDFTIECWVYFNSSVANVGILDLSTTAGFSAGGFSVASYQGKMFAAGAYFGSTAVFTTGTWYHVALVRSSGTLKSYVNGVEQTSASYPTNMTQTYLLVGGYYSTGYLLDGYIDDLRITKGYARYTTTFTPPTAALPNIGPT